MAPSAFNSKSPTIKRILREASELATSPSPDYTASPASDSNLFDWHFTLRGPPSSPYSTGIYHGRIILPPTYPLRPPSFRFLTPSGRFEPNREICLSISGHHEETWQPAWGIRTALVALRSFMETDVKGQVGGLETTVAVRERLAGESARWRCGGCSGGKSNEEILKECAEAGKLDGGKEREEEKVPEELRMGFKDEMGGADGGSKEGSAETSEKEGGEETSTRVDGGANSSSWRYPPPRPAQTVPQPTAPIPPTPAIQAQITSAPQISTQTRQPTQVHIQSEDAIPVWIDRMIVGLVICLVFTVVKLWLKY